MYWFINLNAEHGAIFWRVSYFLGSWYVASLRFKMTKTMFLLRTMLREFEPYLLSFRRSFGLWIDIQYCVPWIETYKTIVNCEKWFVSNKHTFVCTYSYWNAMEGLWIVRTWTKWYLFTKEYLNKRWLLNNMSPHEQHVRNNWTIE